MNTGRSTLNEVQCCIEIMFHGQLEELEEAQAHFKCT